MHVLEGPRREIRRIMLEGSAYWAAPAPTAEVGHQRESVDGAAGGENENGMNRR